MFFFIIIIIMYLTLIPDFINLDLNEGSPV